MNKTNRRFQISTEPLLLRFRRLGVRLATSLQGLVTYGEMIGTRRTYRRQLAMMVELSCGRGKTILE